MKIHTLWALFLALGIYVSGVSAATRIVVQMQPSETAVAGVPFLVQPVLRLENDNGAIDTNDNTTVIVAAVESGTAALKGTVRVQAVNGIIAFTDLFYTSAEIVKLRFEGSEATSLTPVRSTSIVISPSTAVALRFSTEPGNGRANSLLARQPIVHTCDQFGNSSTVGLPATLEVSLTLSSGAGELIGVTRLDAGTSGAKGVAVFTNIQVTVGGFDKHLTATAIGYRSGTSAAFMVGGVEPADPVVPPIDGTFVTLNGPRYHEFASADVNVGMIVLTAPPGFEFDTAGTAPTVFIKRNDGMGNSGNNINRARNVGTVFPVNFRSASEIGFLVTSTSFDATSSMTWQNVRVRGTPEPPHPIQQITKTGAAIMQAVVDGVTSWATLISPQPQAARLVVQVQPSSIATAGDVFQEQPVIRVEDQFGNTWRNSVTVTAKCLNGRGDLQGILTQQSDNGLATFNGLSHNNAGTVTLQFSSGNLFPAISSPIVVQPAQVHGLAFSIQPAGAKTGTPFFIQPVVRTVDKFGNPSVVGLSDSKPITIAIAAGTGTLLGTVNSDVGTQSGNGVLGCSDLQLNVVGEKRLIATANSLESAVSDPFVVAKGDQTISFPQIENTVFGRPPIALNATSSSGLPVRYVLVSGSASLNGNVLTILGAGTVTIQATQPGDANFNAAAPLSRSFDVAKADQTISFPQPSDRNYGEPPFIINAIGSSGLPLTFTVVSGPASVSGNRLTVLATGSITVRASQAGSSNFNAATSIDRTFTVVKGDQAVFFRPVSDKTFGDARFPVEAVASSGLPVAYSIVSGPATIVSNIVTITGSGLVTIRASQPGDSNFHAGFAEKAFTVRKAPQTISFTPIPDQTSVSPPFTISVTASSGLPVTLDVISGPATISGNTLTPKGVGLVSIRATQAGDENHSAAPIVVQTFPITGTGTTPQTIVFDPVGTRSVGDTVELHAEASSGLSVAFIVTSGPASVEGNVATVTGAGQVTIRAIQLGDDTYAPVSVSQVFGANKVHQTIFLTPFAEVTYGDPFVPFIAMASSGLPLQINITGPGTLSYTVGTNSTSIHGSIALTGAGTIRMEAVQPGNDVYEPVFLARSFSVNRAALFVAADNTARLVSEPNPILTGTISGLVPGDEIAPVFSSTATLGSPAGEYPISIVLDDPHHRLTNYNVTLTPGTLTVFSAPQILTQPQNRTVQKGGSASFSVSAAGSGQVSYQWRFNGINIAGATASTFGLSKVFSTNQGTYDVVVTNAVGTIISSQAKLRVISPWDFNADANTDIVCQNTNNAVTLLLMRKGTLLSTNNLFGGSAMPVGWKIVGRADMNGDSRDDLVWQRTNGVVAVWFMNDGNRPSITYVRNGQSATAGWSLAAVHDFNRDKKADFLWKNIDGRLALWIMNGTNVTSTNTISGFIIPSATWRLACVDDFNNDGCADLLYQNNDGRLNLWSVGWNAILARNFVIRQTALRSGPSESLGWRIVGAGDFNDDAQPDLLWQNAGGQLSLWYLNGTNFLSNGSIANGVPVSAGARIVGPR